MNVIRHNTAAEFLDRAGVWLEQAEVENNLILGIAGVLCILCGRAKDAALFSYGRGRRNYHRRRANDPPRQLLTTAMPDDAVIELADYMLSVSAPVPGLVGCASKAELFANYWTAALDKPAELRGRSDSTFAPPFCHWPITPGRLRPATKEDQTLLSEWCVQFCLDAGIEDEITFFKTRLPHKIAAASLFVWETDTVVSMAGFERERPRGVAISWVFTPLRLRGRGYATSCVAALTQRMFDSGRRFCCLYADLANPTSNNIYRTIGYRAVCDVDHWVFE